MDTTKTASVLLAGLAITGLSGTAQAASAELTLVNGDFETDASGSDGATGWIIESNHYWTTDGVSIAGPLDPVGGAEGSSKYLSANYLAGSIGSNGTNSFAVQDVDISAYATDIDAGGVTLDLDFWYINGDDTGEETSVSVEFFSEDFIPMTVALSGKLPETANGPTWTQATIDGGAIAVPTLARFFSIGVNQNRFNPPTETNAGVDQFTARLDGVVPEPSSLSVLGLAALFVMRRRRA